ncbi:MAG: GntR family transcriptional regulator [bacterium]|nr:GntR family transcriptional regulator [bacterium]MDO5522204.1 GntR family transcriptional regulator [bacterium]
MFEEASLRPIFMQIADWVEDEIMKKNLKEGDQVPSTNQFALQFQINPATAGKGINLLVEEGILYKKRGIGMFVNEGAFNVIQTKRRRKFETDYITVLVEEAKKIGIDKSELIKMIKEAE